jgi:hypothetical protein
MKSVKFLLLIMLLWPEADISCAEIYPYSIAAFWSIADIQKQQLPKR